MTHIPLQASFPPREGEASLQSLPRQGPWALLAHSLSPQLRLGGQRLLRPPGRGQWRPGLSLWKRGQRAPGEPAALRAESPDQAGCWAVRAGRPRACSGAALKANMLGGWQPCDAGEPCAPPALRAERPEAAALQSHTHLLPGAQNFRHRSVSRPAGPHRKGGELRLRLGGA